MHMLTFPWWIKVSVKINTQICVFLPKSIFFQYWTNNIKVIQLVSKSANNVNWTCIFGKGKILIISKVNLHWGPNTHSGVTAGGRGAECPLTLLNGKFLTYQENRGKGKWRKKEGKSKMEGGKVTKWGEDLFSFCFSLFKKNWNLFCVYQNGNFLKKRKHFTLGKNSGKMTLPPLKNIPLRPLHANKPLLYIPKSKQSNVRIPIHVCGNVHCTCIDRFPRSHFIPPKSMRVGGSKMGGLSNSLHPPTHTHTHQALNSTA